MKQARTEEDVFQEFINSAMEYRTPFRQDALNKLYLAIYRIRDLEELNTELSKFRRGIPALGLAGWADKIGIGQAQLFAGSERLGFALYEIHSALLELGVALVATEDAFEGQTERLEDTVGAYGCLERYLTRARADEITKDIAQWVKDLLDQFSSSCMQSFYDTLAGFSKDGPRFFEKLYQQLALEVNKQIKANSYYADGRKDGPFVETIKSCQKFLKLAEQVLDPARMQPVAAEDSSPTTVTVVGTLLKSLTVDTDLVSGSGAAPSH
jgi:hypothetical protein